MPSGMVAFCVEKWLVTPYPVTSTLSAWMPSGKFLVTSEMNLSSVDCTDSLGIVKPSALKLTICRSNAVAGHHRLGHDVVQHALQLDGAVGGMGGHACW